MSNEAVQRYPNLGFDPAPGDPDAVAQLAKQLASARDSIATTAALFAGVGHNTDEVWKGQAGTAFRTHVDAGLGRDLGYAQRCLDDATTVLSQWHDTLTSFQDTAAGLERQAAAIHTDMAQATTPAQENQRSELDAVLSGARQLEAECGRLARRAAQELDSAAQNVAPASPHHGVWDRIAGVARDIDKHRNGLHETLASVAGFGSLLAAFTPPPVDALALGVSLVAGVGTLGLDLTDPHLRHELRHGTWEEKLAALETAGGDISSVVPGAGGVSYVAKAAHAGAAAGDVTHFEALARAWTESAHEPAPWARTMTDRNVGHITTVLNGTGLTTATHKVLQFTGVEGRHTVPDPAAVLSILPDLPDTVTGVADLTTRGYHEAREK